MKNILATLILLLAVSACAKKEGIPTAKTVDSTAIIDSINAARTKINDSIRNRNHFADMSGTHVFLHNGITGKGNVRFTKIAGNNDEYEIKGEVRAGKNYATIQGTGIRVSEKHLNFTGSISQSISEYDQGKTYTRKGTKTFLSKDGGKTWRLQDMVNGSGFADYIDIKL